MVIVSDPKFFSAVIAFALIIVADYIYICNIFNKKTRPHLYSWLIWSITQGTASVASWCGGGMLAAICLFAGTILQIVVICRAFKYATKVITKSDTVLLVVALLAIILWWQIGNSYVAVLMVTAIDAIGFIPTFRKSLIDPWSEALSFWSIMTLATFFMIASSAQYNFLTLFYMFIILLGDITVWIICFFRRKVLHEVHHNSRSSW